MTKGKVRKDNRYYTFWGIMTLAVVTGQLYVGLGYRNMTNSIDKAISTMETCFLKDSLPDLKDYF